MRLVRAVDSGGEQDLNRQKLENAASPGDFCRKMTQIAPMTHPNLDGGDARYCPHDACLTGRSVLIDCRLDLPKSQSLRKHETPRAASSCILKHLPSGKVVSSNPHGVNNIQVYLRAKAKKAETPVSTIKLRHLFGYVAPLTTGGGGRALVAINNKAFTAR